MNIYAIIILATIAVDFVLDLVSNYLNLKSLSKELPDEFEGVYDEETYAKSQEYTKTQTRFGFITGGFDLVVLLSFWFSGVLIGLMKLYERGVLENWLPDYFTSLY